MLNLAKTVFILLSGLLLSPPASASVITSIGAGSAVSSVSLQANFTNIQQGTSLLNYSEGGLIISVDDQQCCFSGAYYGSGGNNSFVTITTPNGIDFGAIEVGVGSGFGVASHNIVWQTLRDGGITGSGLIGKRSFDGVYAEHLEM